MPPFRHIAVRDGGARWLGGTRGRLRRQGSQGVTAREWQRGISMVNDAVERLVRSNVVDELHALLWVQPRVNRGELDLGWSCREHAASIDALLTLNAVMSITHVWRSTVIGAGRSDTQTRLCWRGSAAAASYPNGRCDS